jgi:hypothetical protein
MKPRRGGEQPMTREQIAANLKAEYAATSNLKARLAARQYSAGRTRAIGVVPRSQQPAPVIWPSRGR